ncbi:MAG: UDP-galactose-lipid carrier transferase [Chloroflexi bacterium]|nr:UDP-galactose-lipid carrier transferase [Chloroflexota bacterium]MDA1147370.1 UDP-galactose-lipid carrier transferase [Chloroflexota bacterium]
MSERAANGASTALDHVPTLTDFDPTLAVDDKEYKKRRKTLQLQLLRYQVQLRDAANCPVVIVFEGVDAAGKGGAIRRLTGRLDPRGLRVHPTAAPSGDELRHHYLWRFQTRMPEYGQIAIFDRSWYGRVLVERVEELTPPEVWERAYREIAAFERGMVDNSTVLVKFWLHISQEEQLRRFEAREADPFKEYKITPEDWRNRNLWSAYEPAVEEMLRRTHTASAPWTLVSAENKNHSRLVVLETVRAALEARLGPLPR